LGKRDFVIGLVTGALIVTFIGAHIISAKIIYDGRHSGVDSKARVEARQDAYNEVADMVSEKPNTVLTDEDFVKKVMLMEDMIDVYYLDSVTEDQIKDGVFDGIMASIDDPYACYYDAEELLELTQDTQGIYYGIGAYLMLDQKVGYPQVTGIIDDSPASESALRVDDIIAAVDGVDVYNMELSEAVKLIKGPENTDVTLTVVRQAINEELEITLTRRKVETPTVKYEMKQDGIAYIQITEFDSITVTQFQEALDGAYADGMKGLILDLRGNPGGSLAAVVSIGDYMLPKGLVVYTEDKYGVQETYTSSGKHEIDVPMVVLINGGSASASEILAGAIKDYKKGTLMGTTTYGKGIVQRVMSLGDGSAVKLTVSHYYTPLGNDIHKVGIEPDVEVEFDIDAYLEDVDADNQLDEAIEYLEKEIK